MKSKITRTKYDDKWIFSCILGASLILLIVASMNLTNAFAKSSEAKGVESANSNADIKIPPVKLSYGGHTYEMLPFVMVEGDQVKKLNFPQLPDDFQPVVKLPSEGTFNFDFSEKPRETNAFVIDYDADITAISPVNNLGKNRYSVNDVYGPKTLEVRAIYADGKYVTYTLLIDISRIDSTSGLSNSSPKSIKSVVADVNNNPNSNNINNNPNNINTDYSNDNGTPATIADRIIKEYGGMIKMDTPISRTQPDIQLQAHPREQGSNGCIDSEIPVKGVTTNDKKASTNSTSMNTVAKPSSPWIQLDLGNKQQVCGVKVQFKGSAEDVKFFTVELSSDGITYSTPKYYSNTGSSTSPEIYNFHEGTTNAQYIKLTELGKNGSDNEWVSDVKILGPKD
ncbi:MAG: discoidin domain-containing protein [Nitrososphaerota archaeon]